jgi:two-component system, chemotaxis family, CheB/CheR fusion protein
MTAAPEVEPEFESLLDFIKTNRGFDFTGYKRPSLARRTKKRMLAVGVETYGEYLDVLQTNPDEFAELFDTILINVTGFFRDEGHWEYVESEIVPRIVASKAPGQTVRVWCPGCASGEEAYTAAMVFAEALGDEAKERMKVYATDVDEEALSKGRHAVYSSKEIEDVPDRFRGRYFERDGSRYAFDAALRRNVIFGRHDLVQDAPISRIDLLVCRNTLMYLNNETQNRVLTNLNFALNDEGFLFLGKSEMLLTRPHLFTPIDVKRRVFQRVPRGDLREGIRALAPVATDGKPTEILQAAGFESALSAQIVIDEHGTLTLANHQARVLFGLTQDDVGRPIQDLELSYRPAELRSSIQESYSEGRVINLRDVVWDRGSDKSVFDVEIAPLFSRTNSLLGTSISFLDVTRYSSLSEELQESQAQLEQAYVDLQSANEELETTNEELQSTNEELETTNEELQSTNEELETMNEELQSTNEELETMNNEFRGQTTELNTVNSFLETILTGLGAAVIVLDEACKVLAWNATAEELWGLRFDEVRDESFFGLDIGLPVDQLRQAIRGCLTGNGPGESIVSATNRRGQAIRCRVQCKPLDGVVGDRQGVLLLLDEARAEDGG